ncbi:syntaphilin isoform X2 [Denticeps clupeoides]|uniref:Syntaphilin-like n=1 Tax=Denticeps clupeoides TaxID=299321 RepID=A0AAY4E2W4_9TELE|nr:syntaphilin isoform X2 [Denticeps clupeoides]
MSAPANRSSSGGSCSFDYCRFIGLDYIPMEAGLMVSMRQSRGFLTQKSPERNCRRPPAPASNRDPYGNASLSSSSNSGSCKGSDCSPTSRRHAKYTSCTDNHGIRPPPPEQYLTPLQQKEVCIRHLRARLKETVEQLQDRDTEIDDLRTQLSRMQEDWIEEECHRVEAHLALKEARQEIHQLKKAVDVVSSSLGEADTGVQKCFQDINLQNHKLETLLQSMELAQTGALGEAGGGAGAGLTMVGAELEVSNGLSGSCEGSPARSLTRSSTYTKLSDQTLAERNGNPGDYPCLSGEGTQDSGFVCCGESVASRADLLLEETASLLSSYSHFPHSATYERLCGGDHSSHPCLSHHHLYLHHLREQAIQTDLFPASAPVQGSDGYAADLDTIAERSFRSQACSPTSTWLSDEGDDLDSVTTASATTATVTVTAVEPASVPQPCSLSPVSTSCAVTLSSAAEKSPPPPTTPQTGAAHSPQELAVGAGVTVIEVDEDSEKVDEESESGDQAMAPVRRYWSRHFLIDLLAVAVPVVPTLAWLCRGPCRQGQPFYHIGSLLRGCCTVALHSLRRGGGIRHYPAGGGGPGATMQI